MIISYSYVLNLAKYVNESKRYEFIEEITEFLNKHHIYHHTQNYLLFNEDIPIFASILKKYFNIQYDQTC